MLYSRPYRPTSIEYRPTTKVLDLCLYTRDTTFAKEVLLSEAYSAAEQTIFNRSRSRHFGTRFENLLGLLLILQDYYLESTVVNIHAVSHHAAAHIDR